MLDLQAVLVCVSQPCDGKEEEDETTESSEETYEEMLV